MVLNTQPRRSSLWPFRRSSRRGTLEGLAPLPSTETLGLGLVGQDLTALEQQQSPRLEGQMRFRDGFFRGTSPGFSPNSLVSPGFSSRISPGSSPNSLVSPGSSPVQHAAASPYSNSGSSASSPDMRNASQPHQGRRPSWVRKTGSTAISSLVFCTAMGYSAPTEQLLQAKTRRT